MRPTRLEIEGFSTFRERTVLELDGLDLVAFTGATGAGKSTLIDAITFALYGSVARYDNAKLVAPIIHQLAVEAKVRLDFELAGRAYIVTRVVRRRGSRGDAETATTKEARLERVDDDDGAATTVLAGDVRQLSRAVEELLGLDFEQFTRTIVLPQGEFAAFLRDDRADRDKLLQRLLDLGIYERMGRMARRSATRARQQAEILAEQHQRHPPVDDAELARLADRATSLAEARDRAQALAAELTDLDGRLDPLRDRVTTIDDALDRLEPVAVPVELTHHDRELASATERLSDLHGQAAAARAERQRIAAQLEDLPDRGELARTQSVVEQLATARADCRQLQDQLRELATLVASLGDDRRAAEAALADTEDLARAARLAAGAEEWRAELVVGEPCPVCRQEVAAVPDHDAAGELADLEAERRRLDERVRSLSRQLATAEGTSSAAEGELKRQTERIDLLELQLTASSVVPDPDALERQIARVTEAEAEHKEAAARATELEERARAAEAEIESLEQRRRAMAIGLGTLRDGLADLEPPALGHDSLAEDYATLVDWAEQRSATLAEERQRLAEEGKRIAAARAELVEGLTACATIADPDGPTRFELDRLPVTMADALARAHAELAAAEERRAEQDRLAARMAELEDERVVDDALGRHLRSGGFGSWLLAEALDRIVAKATVWLLELSDQQYSLAAGERSFAIVDHANADERRDVRTLSGGETFLASLALALALADSIAELAPVDAPRLESMFLDEGFGTLDPGTLDVVAAAIEELASTGRMIGIVTHVSDLAERMPARFEVAKGPTTSTVELVGR